MGCFSFYPVKNLGAYGDGGMVVTDNEDLASEVEKLRTWSQSSKYHHPRVGMNSRFDEIQAVVLNETLEYLNGWNQRRRRLAAIYDERLEGTNIITPDEMEYAKHVYHLYVIRHEERDTLQDHLEKGVVQTLIHYPVPIHQQEAYADIRDEFCLNVTEIMSDQILSLPLSPWHTEDEIGKICDIIECYGG